jgi:type IV secretory pathway component VirB8
VDIDQRRQTIARLEELGPTQVRLLFSSGGFPTQFSGIIAGWLAEKEAADLARSEALQTEQARTARSAKNAAWIAAIAAIIAAILAVISIVVALK